MSQGQAWCQDGCSSQFTATIESLKNDAEDDESIPEELWIQLKTELEKHNEDCQLFVKQFPDWRDQTQEHIKELKEIAEIIDEYHRGATIASITGTSAAIVGGVLSVTGLIASPFTSGTSLGLSAVGAGVSATGAATNFTADVTESVGQSIKQKRVDEIVNQYNECCKLVSKYLHKICGAIKSWSHNLQAEITKHKSSEQMSDFLTESCGAVKCSEKGGDVSVLEESITVPLSNTARQVISVSQKTESIQELLSGSLPLLSTIVRAISGLLSAIIMLTNIYSITRSSVDLTKGSKTEAAKDIQSMAMKMEDELMAYEDIYQFLKFILKIE
ncbi:apolipoprotein L3-like [Chiloscyllium punctatum]|uniref:apolipoprotein L3-like n=1 Tax=Chiloscyllium punctatum TaxID=137246 RepID=UPI003B638574